MTHLPNAPDPLFLSFQMALAGRYSIDRELGRGGMGVVYLAREVHLDRLVAIKLLPPELARRPALRERFLREAQLAAKLSHPHIIPIHSVDETDGFVYFVMSFVDGETLAQRVQARGPLSASEGIRILREAAWALGYAHSQGLVHRDVKPDNILIEAASGRALVADFGIAAATGENATGENATGESAAGEQVTRNHHVGVAAIHGAVTGTPEFMSPEQALGREVDARSDLYSLGATAFWALSGRLPFEGRTAAELLGRQISEPAPPLSSVGLAVPRKLAQLVDRCLAKDPAQRPRSAQEVADQLGVAIEQRRELPVALRAFVKRNGRMDGGGTVLSLSTAAVAGVVTGKLLGIAAGVAVLGGGVTLAMATFGVVAARQLLRQGFAQADIVPAFRAEQESSREERGLASSGRVRRSLERVLRAITMVSGSTAIAVLGMAVLTRDSAQAMLVGGLSAIGFIGALASGMGYLVLVQSRRDVDVEFWSTLWNGRAGTWAFAIAKRFRGAAPVPHAMTHRATELSLGMAAEELYESLPKARRESLGDVPALLQRLQRDAQSLRQCMNAVQQATSDTFVERTAVEERLRATVGAMETIRLNLLRLHAGSLSLEAFTTHIDQAQDISADVARMIDARAEVEALLATPNDLSVDATRARPSDARRARVCRWSDRIGTCASGGRPSRCHRRAAQAKRVHTIRTGFRAQRRDRTRADHCRTAGVSRESRRPAR